MNQYETLYGVGLLDDLHNYFPALLYDSSSFSTVAEVLHYVQQQARSRFDLYSYGQRDYQSQQPPRVSPRVSPLMPGPQLYRSPLDTPSFRRTVMPMPPVRSTNQTYTTTTTTTQSVPQIQPTNPRIAPMFGTVEVLAEAASGIEDDSNDLLQAGQMLLNLMNAVAPNPTAPVQPFTEIFTLNHPGRQGNRAGLDAFLQPVIVRPTPEQIATHTSLGNLVSDTEHACAICQDVLTSEQEGRKLNACGHWFHRSCIDTWFQRDVHCPVCRHDIREPAATPAADGALRNTE